MKRNITAVRSTTLSKQQTVQRPQHEIYEAHILLNPLYFVEMEK